MKLVKRLVVLVAAMTMVLSLAACGGTKFPATYTYSEPRDPKGKMEMTITLEEDGTYEWKFFATDSKDPNVLVMEQSMNGKYTLDGDKIIIDTVENGKGYYTAGASKTDFEYTKENPGMYVNSLAQGQFEFVIDGDTFHVAD